MAGGVGDRRVLRRRLLPLRPPRGLLQTIPNGERSEREGLKEGVKKVRAARNGGEKRLNGERGRIHSVPGRLVTPSANDSRRGARAREVLVMRFFLSTEREHPDESRIRRSWGLKSSAAEVSTQAQRRVWKGSSRSTYTHMISYVKLKDGKVKVVVYELRSLLFSLIF